MKYRIIRRGDLWVVRAQGKDVFIGKTYAAACIWVADHR